MRFASASVRGKASGSVKWSTNLNPLLCRGPKFTKFVSGVLFLWDHSSSGQVGCLCVKLTVRLNLNCMGQSSSLMVGNLIVEMSRSQDYKDCLFKRE